jgi:antirestriction protein ArdC
LFSSPEGAFFFFPSPMTKPHSRTSRRNGDSRPDALSRLSAAVTGQVLAALRAGVRPWQQPWDSGLIPDGEGGRPLRHTGESYAGVNVLLLWLGAEAAGYRSRIWMTYRQALAYGGQVRGGEHGATVVYADRFLKTVRDAESGEATEQLIPFLKTYTVFNTEQIGGLPDRFLPQPQPALSPEQERERVAAVEAFFAGSGAVIRHRGDTPCYIPACDEIRLPAPGAFRSVRAYYASLAHELIHYAGAPSRLNRDLGRERRGDAGYAREELVAELGAALLCADLGLTPEIRADHAPYIGHWLKLLGDDPRALFTAAAHAERAVAWLRGERGSAPRQAAEAERAADGTGR